MKAILLACAFTLIFTETNVVFGQPGVELPEDIHPETGNRLAPIKRDELDAEGQRAYDLRSVDGVLPPRGTRNVTVYSPIVAEGIHLLGRLASGSSRLEDSGLVGGGVLTPAQAELAILLAGWEIESKVVWTSHEPDAIAAGVPQEVVDTVKFDGSPDEINSEYAAIIRFVRQLYRDHEVDSDVYSELVKYVGERGMVEIVGLMGRYVTLGTLMNAVDQHLSSPNLLPER
jgi:alkylhydroperoxidase family enzyme